MITAVFYLHGRRLQMLGIEMVEIKDLDKSEIFLKEIASDSEIEYVKKSSNESLRNQRLGALLCIKKAVFKTLDLGEDNDYKEVHLSHDLYGKPIVTLHGKALERYNKLFSSKTIEVSLSHTQDLAVAVCLIM